MRRVMLVDDERLPMQAYERALRMRQIEVERFYGVDSALEFARQQPRPIDGIILDVLMPPGKAFEDRDVEGGLGTGFFLYGELRKTYPILPVIVLTNIKSPKVLGGFPVTDPCFTVCSKFQNPPLDFAGVVEKQLRMVLTECTVVCFQGNLCTIAFERPGLGWFEMEVLRSDVPEGVGEAGRLRLQLWFEDDGTIADRRFPPDAILSSTSSDRHLITHPPKDFKDRVQVEDYLTRLGKDLGEE